MALEKPPLQTVSPGQPVTAQGWNGIVNALSTLYDAVLAIGHGTLEVSVKVGDQPFNGAGVIATPAGAGSPVVAVPPFGTRTTYLLTGVSDGEWHVNVIAPGYVLGTATATVPATAPVEVNLKQAGLTVPDLFGLSAADALATLAGIGLRPGSMIDALGKDVSTDRLPVEYQDSPIIEQLPAAQSIVPDTQLVRLVVAAIVQQDPVVTMPNLVGLTQDEALKVLEQLGLRVGAVRHSAVST
jgi:hypothetical protein